MKKEFTKEELRKTLPADVIAILEPVEFDLTVLDDWLEYLEVSRHEELL